MTRSLHDKWPTSLISGRADGFGECVSSSTGGRGMGGEEEDEEEEISHLLQHVTALHSFLCFLLCGKQAWERISSVCLSMHLHIFIFVCTHACSFPYSEWKSFLMVVYISMCLWMHIWVHPHVTLCLFALCFCLCCKDHWRIISARLHLSLTNGEQHFATMN